jgi:hypothetical protein
MEMEPEVIDGTAPVDTVSPVEVVSMIFPAESTELTEKDGDNPWYLMFLNAGI